MKIDPGTPVQARIFCLFSGALVLATGIHGLLSQPDQPNLRWLFRVLDSMFGPYADDWLSIFLGIWMIYFGLFRFEDIKKNLDKYKKTGR